MKRRLPALLLCLAAVAGLAYGESDEAQNHYTLTSLNAPDPVFVPSGDSVAISVTATPAALLRKVTVRLNGDDVTSALSPSGTGSLSGTVAGLQPGINTFEVFDDRKA